MDDVHQLDGRDIRSFCRPLRFRNMEWEPLAPLPFSEAPERGVGQ